jgi:hypothetical protein
LIVLGLAAVVAVAGIRGFIRYGQTTDTGNLAPMLFSGFGGLVGTLTALGALVLLCLGGCVQAPPASPPVVVEHDSACKWVKMLTASPQDTKETKAEVLGWDKAVKENCPSNTASPPAQ